jgi:hypothetical protein
MQLKICDNCGFGYAIGLPHSPEDCAEAKTTNADPCGTCGHGKYYHDGWFCVQAVAGDETRLPGFCGMHDYKEQKR